MTFTPADLSELDPARRGLFRPVARDPRGLTGPTVAQTRGPTWRRTSRGLYVPASVERSTDQRILEASAALPAYGAVTGWAALHWMGGRWFEGTGAGMRERAVTLVTSCDDIRSQPGIAVSAEKLDPRDLRVVAGVRVTTAVRSVLFEMRHAETMREAVVVVDMAAYSDLVSLAEMHDYAALHRGWTGIPQAREALDLAEENSWSPAEVSGRLVWVIDAGLPPPLVNRPVFDLNGRHVGTPDLLDVEAGMAGEYDGAVHLDRSQRAKDLGREEDFRRVGLEYVTIVGSDLADRRRLVRRLHEARSRSRWAPPGARLWTLEPPYWWRSTATVDQRRRLDEHDRRVWLGYRAA